jgi:hypothetical protein
MPVTQQQSLDGQMESSGCKPLKTVFSSTANYDPVTNASFQYLWSLAPRCLASGNRTTTECGAECSAAFNVTSVESSVHCRGKTGSGG